MLNPGGHLAIEVPNVDDALVRYYQLDAFDRFYWQRAHYFNYSHGTLDMVLRRAGFAEVETIPEQRYDISNHIHWIKDGKPGGMGRYTDLFDERLNPSTRGCSRSTGTATRCSRWRRRRVRRVVPPTAPSRPTR